MSIIVMLCSSRTWPHVYVILRQVTRAEFEEACADLFARVTTPIEKALAMANLTLKEINSVELLGGGVRMPKVKKLLEDYFKAGELELGQHLNGDEAMALGAAFRAANLSTAFRVRKVSLLCSALLCEYTLHIYLCEYEYEELELSRL